MQAYDSTPWLLEQWAWWARINHGLKLNFPHQTNFRRQLGTTARSPAINDIVAGEIDLAVSQLCRESPQMGKALCLYYLKRLSYYQIAERLRLDREAARGLVKAGVSVVSDTLDSD